MNHTSDAADLNVRSYPNTQAYVNALLGRAKKHIHAKAEPGDVCVFVVSDGGGAECYVGNAGHLAAEAPHMTRASVEALSDSLSMCAHRFATTPAAYRSISCAVWDTHHDRIAALFSYVWGCAETERRR